MTVLGREDTELVVRLLSDWVVRGSKLSMPAGRELVSRILASWNELDVGAPLGK
jgi:hypothetical protein